MAELDDHAKVIPPHSPIKRQLNERHLNCVCSGHHYRQLLFGNWSAGRSEVPANYGSYRLWCFVPEPYEVVTQQVSTVAYVIRCLVAQSADLNLLRLARGSGRTLLSLINQALLLKGQPLLELFSADSTAQQEALKAERDLTIIQLRRSLKSSSVSDCFRRYRQ